MRLTLRKIARKASTLGFRLFGFDRISRQRIEGRRDLQEIGEGHGSWVVPSGLIDHDSICYCGGCGEDISFDLGLIEEFGCHVYAFDPTPRAALHVREVAGGNAKYHFYEYGLWSKEDELKFYAPKDPSHVSRSLLNLQKTDDYISVSVKRLSSVMKELGHSRIDLLKIDIEGAEYKVIESILEDGLDVRVLCVEYDEYFHPLDADFRIRIRASIEGLIARGYTLVYSQGNGNYTLVRGA
jgi:FkbM family methyltransferase